MNTTLSPFIKQRFQSLQYEFIPFVRDELPTISHKLEQVIRVIEWSNIESEVYFYRGSVVGRPPSDRCALACSFIAKSVLGIVTTEALIERLEIDRALRRICGFCVYKKLPEKSTFSRAFAEFAASGLIARVHENMIKQNLGDVLIGHLSRDATMIPARERVPKKDPEPTPKPAEKNEVVQEKTPLSL